VSTSTLPDDPLWPRASEWFVPVVADSPHTADFGLLGVPAWRTSITPTRADTTPRAVRQALARFSTFAGSRGVDVSVLRAIDLGDVDDPDGPEGEARVAAVISEALDTCRLIVALGGDNSITHSMASALLASHPGGCGLITLDAHHDLREGISNGSPVRRLIDAGLPGDRVVQIGIADFANSAAYARRARESGITVIPRADLRGADLAGVVSRALAVAGREGGPVYVDLDVDVCDRAAVPGCPSAAPGGISADELRLMTYLLARDARVRVLDITEIDASTDSPDGRTVRLAALLVLEAAAGLATRKDGRQ
jgi:arginase family enzyme